MPTCALSTAGKAAIDAALAGALDIGQFKIGDNAGDVLDAASTNISGNLTYTGAAADVQWASFGANKLNLYLRLYGTTEVTIGNLIIFLSDNTTPLAYLTFDQKLVKRANVANKAQDSILLVISLRRTGITDKFDIAVEQSRNFSLPEFDTKADFDAARELFGIINQLPEADNTPVMALKLGGEVWINPSFEKTDAGGNAIPYLSGGIVGDQYLEADFTWTMEWV